MKKTLKAATFVVISMASGWIHADLQGQLDDMMRSFNDPARGIMGNATAPDAYMSATRGVAYVGALSVRSNIKSATPWNVSAPSIRAGCGGIDFYGGSFSLISKEEFINMLRAIGQNAVGYAFQLALESTCPTCAKIMGELADKINRLAGMLSNSCETAQMLVNNDWTDVRSAVEDVQAEMAETSMAAKDWLSSKNQSVSGSTAKEQAETGAPDENKKRVHGNLVWRAMHKQNFANEYAGGDTALMRAVLSMYGTVVVAAESTESGDGDVSNPRWWQPLLDAEDLFAARNAGDKKDVYTCPDGTGEDECLTMQTSTYGFKGMRTKVERIMIGDGTTKGLVQKWAQNTGSPTNEEKAFINLTGPVGTLLHRITRINEGLGIAYARDIAGALSIEYVEFLIARFSQHVHDGLANMEHPAIEKLEHKMQQRTRELHRQVRSLRDTHGAGMTEILAKGELYLKQAQATKTVDDSPVNATTN